MKLPHLSRCHILPLALVLALFFLTGLLSAQAPLEESQGFQERFQSHLLPSLESFSPADSLATEEEKEKEKEKEKEVLVYQQQELYVQESLTNPPTDTAQEAESAQEVEAPDTAETPDNAEEIPYLEPLAPAPSATPVNPAHQATPQPLTGSDSGQSLTLLRSATGVVDTIALDTYLWGVLAAEMPASFPLEALKAQAVAARSYTIQRVTNPKHQEAQICDSPACCQAYSDLATRLSSWGSNGTSYQEKLASAIAQTDGLYVLYQGQPINALFFSSSWGQTLPSQEVWGGTVDYLRSVSSPESQIQDQIPSYHHQLSFSSQEVSAKLLGKYPATDLSASPEQWFSQRVNDSVGGVGQYTIGGVTLTGTQIRSLFGLRSTYFTVYYSEGVFTFSTTGYGHNVGMSQYGAKAMAESGYHFAQILTWYYTGTTVQGYV